MEEIINRVSNSSLITIDLEDYYPVEDIVILDLSLYLEEGMVLREKNFRDVLQKTDWTAYKNKNVILTLFTDALVPSWAFMLLASQLAPYAKTVHLGDQESFLQSYYQDQINLVPPDRYKGKKIIIKGCGEKKIPESVYVYLMQKLQTTAASIMYGEACSTVPLYKTK